MQLEAAVDIAIKAMLDKSKHEDRSVILPHPLQLLPCTCLCPLLHKQYHHSEASVKRSS